MALFQQLEIGQPKLSTIKEWQERGYISKKQVCDHRKMIKELATIPINDKGNDLINELDRKIKDVARYW